MRFILLLLCFTISPVTSPPPLDIELRAEKEYLDFVNEKKELKKGTLREDTNKLTSNTNEPQEYINESIAIRNIGVDFAPMTLPTQFDQYDLNKDMFIDEEELEVVIGAIENINLALTAADKDGKSLIYHHLPSFRN